MFCPKCGAPLTEGAKFCMHCGSAIPGMAGGFPAAGSEEKAKETAYNWYETSPSGNMSAPTPARSAENAESFSDVWAWLLATVPLSASFVLSLLEIPVLPIVFAIGLNIVFLMLDVKELRDSGRDPGAWMYLGIVIVPAYLFVRAARTNKNYGPGIVWCILFGISEGASLIPFSDLLLDILF